ncbi:MAG: hypothetical protein JSU87_13975 [Gemmatimonadota bacterium]|nr:MAG: hypothetical protein JSU87_13975 [Gemmatimonadota bacterium]
MTRSGIVAALVGLAAIVLVLVVGQDMRDSGFIIRAYIITAAILVGYTWSLARRLERARRAREERQSGS